MPRKLKKRLRAHVVIAVDFGFKDAWALYMVDATGRVVGRVDGGVDA